MAETMLLTTHEVLGVLQAGTSMCRLESGSEALLRKAGEPIGPESLCEQRAIRDGLPIVQLTTDDAWAVAHGKTALVTALDGRGGAIAVQVRVMTPQELLNAHARACRAAGDTPRMTHADAVRLTETL